MEPLVGLLSDLFHLVIELFSSVFSVAPLHFGNQFLSKVSLFAVEIASLISSCQGSFTVYVSRNAQDKIRELTLTIDVTIVELSHEFASGRSHKLITYKCFIGIMAGCGLEVIQAMN